MQCYEHIFLLSLFVFSPLRFLVNPPVQEVTGFVSSCHLHATLQADHLFTLFHFGEYMAHTVYERT